MCSAEIRCLVMVEDVKALFQPNTVLAEALYVKINTYVMLLWSCLK